MSLVRRHKVLNRATRSTVEERNGFTSAGDAMLGGDETTDDPALANRRDIYKVETIESKACCSSGRASTRHALCLPTTPGVVVLSAVDHSTALARVRTMAGAWHRPEGLKTCAWQRQRPASAAAGRRGSISAAAVGQRRGPPADSTLRTGIRAEHYVPGAGRAACFIEPCLPSQPKPAGPEWLHARA